MNKKEQERIKKEWNDNVDRGKKALEELPNDEALAVLIETNNKMMEMMLKYKITYASEKENLQ